MSDQEERRYTFNEIVAALRTSYDANYDPDAQRTTDAVVADFTTALGSPQDQEKTPCERNPVVWAAAYSAAFLRTYERERGMGIYQTSHEDALRRAGSNGSVHVEIANAAVMSLYPEEP